MKIGGVYSIRNLINGKRYVGSAVYLTQRFCDHKKRLRKGRHHSIKMQRAWDKHGEDNFSFDVLEIVQDKTLLVTQEQKWIEFYRAAHPRKGYNVSPTAGNCLGVKHTPETIAKIRAAIMRRPPQSAETIAKRVAKLKGQKRTPELRALLAAKKIGNTYNRGRKHTPQARANMSAARKGIKYSAETIARMSAAHIGHKPSQETRAKLSESARVDWIKRRANNGFSDITL